MLDKSTGRVRELGRDDKGRPFGAMIVRPDFNAPTDGREKKKRPVAVNRQRFIDAFNEAILAAQEIRVHGDGPIVKASRPRGCATSSTSAMSPARWGS